MFDHTEAAELGEHVRNCLLTAAGHREAFPCLCSQHSVNQYPSGNCLQTFLQNPAFASVSGHMVSAGAEPTKKAHVIQQDSTPIKANHETGPPPPPLHGGLVAVWLSFVPSGPELKDVRFG